ncbi:MAG TPA: periplasmic heavy metal sensor [Rhizomicrobium sp.]|nr:periplasmic heavy metal sensor [Rhizomicrobium sp.]
MSDATPSAPRRPSVLLIVSLCLNVVLIPVVALIIYRAAHHMNQIGSGGVMAPRSVMAEAPAEHDRIDAIIARHEPKIRMLRAAAADARREAFRTLGAADYTQGKFDQALAAVAAADSALERENIAMMAESLATLTPKERAELVARVHNRLRFWRPFQPRALRD